jgi:hypothetical protein
MSEAAWTEEARDEAYTLLARAITEAGAEGESLFLARLCLLMFEELGSLPRAISLIEAARLESGAAAQRELDGRAQA